MRFRCHTGHAFTADSLLAALTEPTEDALWNAVRVIEESAMLLAHMADHVAPIDAGALAGELRRSSEAELRRAQAVRALIPGDGAAAGEGAKKVS